VKTTPETSTSIGFNIFMATLGVVSVILLLTSLVFLGVFSGTLSDMVESQSREINKQIVMNYEGYINSVIETANYIQFASFDLDVGRDSGKLAELYEANADIKGDVVSIFLFDAWGRRLIGPALDFAAVNVISGRRWFALARDIKEIYHFTYEQEPSIAANRDDDVISVSKSIEYVRNGRASDGILLIELNKDSITDLARKTNLGQGGHLLILDERGNLLYSSEMPLTARTENSLALAKGMHLGGIRASIGRVDMYLYVNTLIQTRWRIVTVSNVDEINGAMRRLAGILVAILIVAVAVSALVAGVISLRVSRPINQLKTVMLRIEEGDFSVPVDVTGQKEIVLLSHSFNSMVLKVRDLMASLVDEQREKRKTELRALQNQINPHFLYNTLDSIVWLAENQRTKDVITTVVALARLFRISISKGETFIRVQDEITHVRNYLTIQGIRYADKFTWSLDFQPEMQNLKVMKLILQPLVENAIQHGVGDEAGRIGISGRIEDGFLVFRVKNSGYGIPESKIRQMYETMRGSAEHPSVGMRNVYQRLKLYYGERADISIESVQDEETTVTLFIPMEYHVGEESS
jgi:two-component system, sensor histidine kinase YesM